MTTLTPTRTKPVKRPESRPVRSETVLELPSPRISVCMTIRDRAHLLERTMHYFRKQDFPRQDWELVIVDDSSKDDLKHLIRKWGAADGMRIQYIVMDQKLSDIPVMANCPALGLNIAFRHARAPYILKTDPEVLPISPTLQQACDSAAPDRSIYGTVYNVPDKVQELFEGSFMLPEDAPGACTDLVSPGHKVPFYFMAVYPKELIWAIGGIDERYLSGVAGEDDDFSLRIQYAGAKWDWNFQMMGLHQYHGPAWYSLPGREPGGELHDHNLKLLQDLGAKLEEPVYPMNHEPRDYEGSQEERCAFVRVNQDREWGGHTTVIDERMYENGKETQRCSLSLGK